VASTGTGILTATDPAQARHTWPRRLGVGAALVAVAVAALVMPGVGGRLVLGAAGLSAVARGLLLTRAAAIGAVDPAARRLGAPLALAGAAAVVVTAVSAPVTTGVLLVGVPVLLLAAAGALVAQGGLSRRLGQGLLVWSLMVLALLVAAAVARGWSGAGAVATAVAALSLAGLGVALLVGAATLRAVATRPPANPAYPAPAGCAGCACGAGGCGAVSG
jgi:hypothetical protein